MSEWCLVSITTLAIDSVNSANQGELFSSFLCELAALKTREFWLPLHSIIIFIDYFILSTSLWFAFFFIQGCFLLFLYSVSHFLPSYRGSFMLFLKSGSPGISLWTSFAPKIQGWSCCWFLIFISSQSWFLIYRFPMTGALMSKTGELNVFRPKQNLEQWLYMRKTGQSHSSMLLLTIPRWCFCCD